jgi:hypothetical protein
LSSETKPTSHPLKPLPTLGVLFGHFCRECAHLLSLSACEQGGTAYRGKLPLGHPSHYPRITPLRGNWNGSRSGERLRRLREDAEVGAKLDTLDPADAERAELRLLPLRYEASREAARPGRVLRGARRLSPFRASRGRERSRTRRERHERPRERAAVP